jgi:hypothetical protein
VVAGYFQPNKKSISSSRMRRCYEWMPYRKSKQSADGFWHFNSNCPSWPQTDYTELTDLPLITPRDENMAQAFRMMKAPFDRTEWFGIFVIVITIAFVTWIVWQVFFAIH